jgi:hypothetical protein
LYVYIQYIIYCIELKGYLFSAVNKYKIFKKTKCIIYSIILKTVIVHFTKLKNNILCVILFIMKQIDQVEI